MIVPLDSAFSPKPSYDVCIIGAGVAGITLATQLGGRGHSVFLAEAGDLEYTDRSQEHYEGAVVGDEYIDLNATRLRYFGGSSNHWVGWCRKLDPYDFSQKSASSMSGWPISADDLEPFDRAARQILEIPEQPEDKRLPETRSLKRIHFVFSPPVHFGQKYRSSIEGDENIDACLNCNLVDLEFGDVAITAARFRNYDEHEIVVSATFFILCCGGIENSRILLIQNTKANDRIGNQGDCIGRYWMDHPHFTIGDFFLFDEQLFGRMPSEKSKNEIFLAPTFEFMQDQKIMNCSIRLLPLADSYHGMKKYVADLLCMAPDLSVRLLEQFGKSLRCGGRIRAVWEQEPTRSSRITLGERDAFGLPRPILNWRKSALDRKTVKIAAIEVGRYLAKRDEGRIRLDKWLLDPDGEYPADDELAGNHHMGGTRMAASPKDGVVDANCLVFGTRNLFVAGSSVFPSGGHSNPTQTIVQLALRLSDHLTGLIAQSSTTSLPGPNPR